MGSSAVLSVSQSTCHLLGIEPDCPRHRSIPSPPELIVPMGIVAGSLAPIYKGVGIALLKREGARDAATTPCDAGGS